jgi:hypothetical protein
VDGMHVGEPALPDHFNSLLTQAELFIFRLWSRLWKIIWRSCCCELTVNCVNERGRHTNRNENHRLHHYITSQIDCDVLGGNFDSELEISGTIETVSASLLSTVLWSMAIKWRNANECRQTICLWRGRFVWVYGVVKCPTAIHSFFKLIYEAAIWGLRPWMFSVSCAVTYNSRGRPSSERCGAEIQGANKDVSTCSGYHWLSSYSKNDITSQHTRNWCNWGSQLCRRSGMDNLIGHLSNDIFYSAPNGRRSGRENIMVH